jgi:hypothetical protein
MNKSTTTTKKTKTAPQSAKPSASPSALIDARIKELSGWRGETLARVRRLIKEACPDVVEDVKWRKPSNPLGVPVWERDGILCTGETYKAVVKLTFARPLSGRVGTGRRPESGRIQKGGAHSDAKPVPTFAECALALRSTTLRACSMRASKATRGAPSTSTRATGLTATR